jgi:hypothetical protein
VLDNETLGLPSSFIKPNFILLVYSKYFKGNQEGISYSQEYCPVCCHLTKVQVDVGNLIIWITGDACVEIKNVRNHIYEK